MEITSSDSIVQKFYAINQPSLFWFSSNQNIKKAKKWIIEIEAAQRYGIVSDQLQIDQIKTVLSKKRTIDNELKEQTDQQITGLVLNYMKDFQEGNAHFDYDEIKVEHDYFYIAQLLSSKRRESVSKLLSRLECKDPDYLILKKYLNDSISENDTLKYKAVIVAMNYRKHLSFNRQQEYIVVNIPEAMARYYRNNSMLMEMRAVAGKTKTPTPTIASHISIIVTFPFWNVPHSIAAKEILQKVQNDEIYLERNNLYVVDGMGINVDDSLLNWENFTEKTFPYYFRQSTGSMNSLGVLKFDLQSPFSIYLHSTSSQSSFLKDYRFLSHGCIRLEKPIDLAEGILRGKLDIEELKRGKKDTVSAKLVPPNLVQVFIIYSPVAVIENRVTFLPDVYRLIK